MVKRAVVDDFAGVEKRNHDVFVPKVQKSRPAVLLMAEWVEENWWMKTKVPDEFIVGEHKDHKKGSDNGDFLATYDGTMWWRLEVKHRIKYKFTTRWLFPTIYVCTVYSFDKSNPPPYGFFYVSGDMKYAAFLEVGPSRKTWTVELVETEYEKPKEQHDNPAVYGKFTKKAEFTYVCPIKFLRYYDLSTKRPRQEDYEPGPGQPE